MAKSAKQTFKESQQQFAAIGREIVGGRVKGGIYLLMGDESYFIDELSHLFATRILNEAEKSFNQIVVYGKDTDGGAVVNFCRQMPMMGALQLVIVKEAQAMKRIEQLLTYAKQPLASTLLVLCHKEKNMDKRTPLYKAINEHGIVFESVQPRDYEVGAWLGGYIASRGLTIDPRTLQLLSDHLGNDLSKISGEIDKLTTSMPVGTKNITAELVEQNIGISREFNNFELTRALSERNLTAALRIADYFASNPKSNPLVVTISMLFNHFQRIFLLNYLVWQSKKKGVQMPSEMDQARILKLPTPFFLKEYQQAATNYPLPKVFEIIGYIRDYDMKNKGMNTGSADDGELLRELILKILMK